MTLRHRTDPADTAAFRERMNMCSIRGIEDKIGPHPAFMGSFYRKHFDLPCP